MSNQKPRTVDEQISRLKNQGMEFNEEELVKKYLGRVSYFQLTRGSSRLVITWKNS